MLRIEVFVNHPAQLGEGPLWDPQSNRLYWVDTYGKALLSVDSAGGDMRTWPMPEPIGACALREKGGAIVALRSGFFELDLDNGEVKLLCETHPGFKCVFTQQSCSDRFCIITSGSAAKN